MINILVVEDDTALNYIVSSFLKENGYSVISCKNAFEALEKIEEGMAHMIISDIMMPGMDGYKFAKAVRMTDKKIPILFITAKDDIDSKQRGFDSSNLRPRFSIRWLKN